MMNSEEEAWSNIMDFRYLEQHHWNLLIAIYDDSPCYNESNEESNYMAFIIKNLSCEILLC